MRAAFVLLLLAHGGLHLLGFVKGFGLRPVDGLKTPISRAMGLLWLGAALAFVAAAATFASAPASWWRVAALAIVLSQVCILSAWQDARFGSLANLLVALPVLVAGADRRSESLRSRYQRDAAAIEAPTPPVLVTEAELSAQPLPIQRYLRRVGVVGRPHVQQLHARFRGQLRNGGPEAAWMQVDIEQRSTFGAPLRRLFFLQSSLYGLPFDGYHRFVDATARMEIKALGLFTVVDGRGPEMDRSETVTVFNDMCLLAPAALLDAKVEWRVMDERRVEGAFRGIHAELLFDEQGDLVSFVSDDRRLSSDGKTFTPRRWTTPIRDYRLYPAAGVRLASRGEAVWLTPEGPLPYARFDVEDVRYAP